MKILITGASGYIGKNLCFFLQKKGYDIVAAVRDESKILKNIQSIVVGSINKNTDWTDALNRVDVVIHLAGKAHFFDNQDLKSLKEFKEINVNATTKLARDSINTGIKTFIFLSSIGVNGSQTFKNSFKSSDQVNPHSHYALSKYEAEQNLQRLFNKTSSDLVILRAPLVYGINAPGNIALISRFLKKNIPLPFGKISNKRSFIAIENLHSIIELSLVHPKAKNKIILLSDGYDLSTKEFVQILGIIYKIKPILLSVNPRIIEFFLRLLGKRRIYESLFLDLQIDSNFLFNQMNWKPVLRVKELIKKINEKTS